MHINVFHFQFSKTVEYVDDCFNNSMMPANVINKQRLQDLIDEKVTARYKANFELAFEEAFSLLRDKVCRSLP